MSRIQEVMPRAEWHPFYNPIIIGYPSISQKSDRAKETHVGARTTTFSFRLDIRSGTRSHTSTIAKCAISSPINGTISNDNWNRNWMFLRTASRFDGQVSKTGPAIAAAASHSQTAYGRPCRFIPMPRSQVVTLWGQNPSTAALSPNVAVRLEV